MSVGRRPGAPYCAHVRRRDAERDARAAPRATRRAPASCSTSTARSRRSSATPTTRTSPSRRARLLIAAREPLRRRRLRQRPPAPRSRGRSSRIGSIAYIGNHGVRAAAPRRRPTSSSTREVAALGRARSRRSPTTPTTDELQRLRVRRRGQGRDRRLPLARRARRGRRRARPCATIAERAEADGLRDALGPQGARGPPAGRRSTRAAASAALLRDARPATRRCTSATTRTDVDAFRGLRALVDAGDARTRCASASAPTRRRAELEEAADPLVDGPRACASCSRRCSSRRRCASSTSSGRPCCSSARRGDGARRRHRARGRRGRRRRCSCRSSSAGGSLAARDRACARAPRADHAADRAAARRARRPRRRCREQRPGAILVNRLWPLLLLTLLAGGLALLAPQIPGDRRRASRSSGRSRGAARTRAVAAIEERDGVALLRRADLAAAPDRAAAHAGLQGATCRRSRRNGARTWLTWRRGPTSCSSRSARPPGLRASDDALAGALRRAGARVEVAPRRAAAQRARRSR